MEVPGIKIMVDNLPQVSVDEIIIQEGFKKKMPKPQKIKQCYAYYRMNHKFDRCVILNENRELIDGYVAYLIANMLDIKTVPALMYDSRQKGIVI